MWLGSSSWRRILRWRKHVDCDLPPESIDDGENRRMDAREGEENDVGCDMPPVSSNEVETTDSANQLKRQ